MKCSSSIKWLFKWSTYPIHICTVFTPIYKQVFICAIVCIVSGVYYGAIISTNMEAIPAHTGDIVYHGTQTIRQVATSPRFEKPIPTKKIQDLKTTIRERTEELTSHIKHYCNTTKLPGPPVDPNYPNRYRMYFDFAHSFLYCPQWKVNPPT